MNQPEKIQPTKSSAVKTLLRIAAWVIFSTLLIAGIAMLSIQIPGVQQRAKNLAVGWLQKKTGASISAGRISIIYPSTISLNDVFIGDNRNDTLLLGKYLGVDLDLISLVKGKILINEVWLRDINAKLHADSAGHYNFDHILQAFSSKSTAPETKKDKSAPLSIELTKLKLNRVNFLYHDEAGGLKGDFFIDQLSAKTDSID
ncbi:MAG: AsmA family protein, partial [Chitinophagaceae bacterium]|nr:AsmA family protein [Chitinophagaceae bacterium]